MPDLPLASQTGLAIRPGRFALHALLPVCRQAAVLHGRAMRNPDGWFDDWHRQCRHVGMAPADPVLICPAALLGLVPVFLAPRWGCFPMALAAFR